MPKSIHQKKIEKRNAKSKAKRKKASRAGSLNVEAKYINSGLKKPIAECVIDNSNAEQGMRHLRVTKIINETDIVIMAAFLLDTYCLGVKNAFIKAGTMEQYIDYKSMHPFENISPEDAKKILLDTVQWSRNIGFDPHKDYKNAVRIFDGIDEKTSNAEIEFGRDGSPFFISGPSDSPAKCQKIIDILNKNRGD